MACGLPVPSLALAPSATPRPLERTPVGQQGPVRLRLCSLPARQLVHVTWPGREVTATAISLRGTPRSPGAVQGGVRVKQVWETVSGRYAALLFKLQEFWGAYGHLALLGGRSVTERPSCAQAQVAPCRAFSEPGVLSPMRVASRRSVRDRPALLLHPFLGNHLPAPPPSRDPVSQARVTSFPKLGTVVGSLGSGPGCQAWMCLTASRSAALPRQIRAGGQRWGSTAREGRGLAQEARHPLRCPVVRGEGLQG